MRYCDMQNAFMAGDTSAPASYYAEQQQPQQRAAATDDYDDEGVPTITTLFISGTFFHKR
jgi:hypothetical protein